MIPYFLSPVNFVPHSFVEVIDNQADRRDNDSYFERLIGLAYKKIIKSPNSKKGYYFPSDGLGD